MPGYEACAPGWAARRNRDRTFVMDEDGSLVTRFLAGDAAAFDTLFSKYQTYVYNIIYGIVGSAEEARDLTQDVFLQVYRSLPRFRHGSRFATWLYRIAANRAVDAARSSRNWRFLPLTDEPTLQHRAPVEEGPESSFARGAEREEVRKILWLCPVNHREILVLRYYQDLSLEEISEVLGCSLAAAKVRLHRARLNFKSHYTAAENADGATPKEQKGGQSRASRSSR